MHASIGTTALACASIHSRAEVGEAHGLCPRYCGRPRHVFGASRRRPMLSCIRPHLPAPIAAARAPIVRATSGRPKKASSNALSSSASAHRARSQAFCARARAACSPLRTHGLIPLCCRATWSAWFEVSQPSRARTSWLSCAFVTRSTSMRRKRSSARS
eukprot:scaffold17506_cov132-Isochrysis_galbana.AAC.8